MASCGTEELDGSCFPSSCCSTVHITFTDETFLELYFRTTDPVTAVFAPHPTNPILDFREVYMWKENGVEQFCMWFAVSAWRIGSCANVGTGSYSIKTENNANRFGRELIDQHEKHQ